MHALMILARTTLTRSEFETLGAAKAAELRSQPGLMLKAYVYDDGHAGGFHVFTNRAAAESYLASPAFRQVVDNPRFSDWDVRHLDVMEDASLMNGTPAGPLVGGRGALRGARHDH